MKFCVVNKSTILNRFVLHTLQRNITHLAVIIRKTNIILGILKGGTGKDPAYQSKGQGFKSHHDPCSLLEDKATNQPKMPKKCFHVIPNCLNLTTLQYYTFLD